MIKINLNPKKEKKKLFSPKGIKIPTDIFSFKNENIILIVVPSVMIASALIYSIYLDKKIDSLKEKKETLSLEIQKYKTLKAKIDSLKKEVEENEKLSENLNLKMKTYEHMSSSNVLASKTLRISVDSIPDGVWLENIVISTDKSNISGYAFQPDYITKYYNNLATHYSINFSAAESKVSPTNLTYYTFNFELKNLKDTKKERAM